MKTKRFAILVLAIAAVSVLAVATPARRAAARNWNVGSGNWSVPGNWSPSGTPAAGEATNIVFTNGTARTVTYNVTAPTLGLLTIDLTGAGATTNTLSLTNNLGLTAGALFVGGYNGITSTQTNGRGAVNQTNGFMAIDTGGDMVVGYGAGSTGTYTLSGSGLLSARQSETIGISGAGTVNQSGGQNLIHLSGVGSVALGINPGSVGTYNLSGGFLDCLVSEYIGYGGTGALNQTGGTNTMSSAGKQLFLGYLAGSTGTYSLGDGSLSVASDEIVGYSGNGTFNQYGGTNTMSGAGKQLFLGYSSGSTGTYALSAGSLSVAADEIVGYSGNGTFNHTGGTNTVGGTLYIGNNAGSSSSYTINNSASLTAGNVIVGNLGAGTMTIQNNASVYISGNLSIKSNSAVNLSGGTLRFGSISGTGGLSKLNYTGGTIRLPGNHNYYTSGDLLTSLYGSFVTIPTGKGAILDGELTLNSIQNFTVDGGSLTTASLRTGTIGFTKANLLILNGGTVTTTGDVFIGSHVDADESTILVSGPGTKWMIGGYLIVGGNAPGTLTIADGALVHVGNYIAGNELRGTVNLRGGTLRINIADSYLMDAWLNYESGTIQLSGNRSIGSDAIINALYGSAPILTSEKGLTVEGTATLQSPTTLDGGTLTVNQLVNGNHLRLLRGTLNIKNQAVNITTGGLLGNALDLNDDMTVNVTLGMNNSGLVTGDGEIGGTFSNAASGELRAEPGRSLKLTGASNTNAGQFNLYGGMLDFTQNLTNNAGAFISGSGTLKVATLLTNRGTMNFSGLANIVGDVTNTATGKVISSGGGPTTFHDDVTNQAGSEIRTSNGSFTVFFGAVTGTTSFTGTGTVNFEGDLKPGSSPAQLNFAGNVGFGPAAALEIEIGGTTPGTQYDKLNVTGNLALDGALEVSLINGFIPSAGQSFNILDWGSLAGTFSSINLPTLAGLAWNTSQLSRRAS